MLRSIAALCLWLSVTSASAQDCRDATGEPTPCPSTPSTIVIEATVSSAPASAPIEGPIETQTTQAPEAEPTTFYGGLEAFIDVLQPGGLHFTQAGPLRAPELARDALVLGAPEVVVGGLSYVLGVRPLPWLRLPELRLSAGGGDYERTAGTWSNGLQSESASLSSVFVLRLEVGGGFEVNVDDVSFFALGHVALAGYFVDAELSHPTAGSLGVATLAEDAWELGWTAGISVHLGDGVRMNVAYRHIHTGAESNSLRFGLEFTGE